MKIASVQADHYRIELPVTLSDSTHGQMSHFELVTARVRDSDGAQGSGYTFTVGANGHAVHQTIVHNLAPRLIGVPNSARSAAISNAAGSTRRSASSSSSA